MKLQKLSIKNLASIEEAVIDFENGPLSEESLFLICGDTGAGKTTILDAICLALYNETPRIDQAAKEEYKDTEHAFSGKKEWVAINDSRQLVRRNSTEALVRLAFIGSNGVAYIAKWNVARAHHNLSGALQDVRWTLIRGNHEISRKSEIKEEIQAAIGLTFKQFCRTTMLAQGDFTKFLQSKESEKSDILEKLTGTEIYSEIGAEIYATTKEKKMEYENLKQNLENIQTLSEEEIAAVDETIAKRNAEIRKNNERKKAALAKRDWLKRYSELLSTQEQQENSWKQKLAQIQSDEYKRDGKLITDWNATVDARSWLATLKKQREQQQANNEQVEAQKASFVRLSGGTRWLTNSLHQQEELLQRVESYLQAHLHLHPMFEQSQSIIAELNGVLNCQKDIESKNAESNQLIGQRPATEKERADKEEEYRRKGKENSDLQEEINGWNRQLEAMNRSALQAKRNKLDAVRENLSKALNDLTLLAEKGKTLNDAKQNERVLKAKVESCQKEHDGLQTNFDHAKAAYDEHRLLYDKQKEAVEDWAKEARSRLAVGDLCPVCGQEVKTLHKDEDFQSILTPIKEALDKKEKAYREAEQALNKNRADFKSHTSLLTEAEKSVAEAIRGYNLAKADAQIQCAKCGVSEISVTTANGLEKQLEETKKELGVLDEGLAKAEELGQHIHLLQQKKNECQKSVDDARRAFLDADNRLKDLNHSISNCQSFIDSEKEKREMSMSRVAPLILWQEWQTEWESNPTSFMDRLRNAADNYKKMQDKKRELHSAIALVKNDLEGISTNRRNIVAAFPEWNDLTTEKESEIKELGRAWSNLNTKISGLKQGISTVSDNIEHLQADLTAFYAANPTIDEGRIKVLSAWSSSQIEELHNSQSRLMDEVVAASATFNETGKQIREHKKQKPDMEENETVETLSNLIQALEDEITAGNQFIGEKKALLDENARNLEKAKKVREQADGSHTEYLKWDRLCHLFGDYQGKTFRNIAQSFVLKELLADANFYLQRLTDRYELVCQAGSLTILLRDYHQGGAARPTCTLSGGESFLVSLSLALGLSALSRQSLSVDTLLIDEGFGTLSSDYLNTVMDTLEKLHQMGGKKVGIISHVEGLRERIKTQIQVRRIDSSRSEIHVVSDI